MTPTSKPFLRIGRASVRTALLLILFAVLQVGGSAMQSPMPNARSVRRLSTTVRTDESGRESSTPAEPRAGKAASDIPAPPRLFARERDLETPVPVFGIWVMGAMYHRPPPQA